MTLLAPLAFTVGLALVVGCWIIKYENKKEKMK